MKPMFLLLLLPSARSHGNLVWPPVWWDRGGQVGLSQGASCQAGAQYAFHNDSAKSGANCFWHTNYTHIVGQRTLEPGLRTYPRIEDWAEDVVARNPWMAPGSAPVFSPCGAAG